MDRKPWKVEEAFENLPPPPSLLPTSLLLPTTTSTTTNTTPNIPAALDTPDSHEYPLIEGRTLRLNDFPDQDILESDLFSTIYPSLEPSLEESPPSEDPTPLLRETPSRDLTRVNFEFQTSAEGETSNLDFEMEEEEGVEDDFESMEVD